MANPKFFPVKEKDSGSHVEGYGRAMSRDRKRLLFFNALPAKTRNTWGWWHKRMANGIKKQEGDKQDGRWNSAVYGYLLDAQAFDLKATYLVNSYKPPVSPKVPNLGPVWVGGKSVLQHDLTHATAGIPLYPAFDDAYVQGRQIIAPEDMMVTRSSSSQPGLAFYATGASKIKYWFAHLDRTHKPGKVFKKGEVVGRVAPNSIGGGPHVHVGVNVESLWGSGKQMIHKTTYTHGAPTIGAQLKAHK